MQDAFSNVVDQDLEGLTNLFRLLADKTRLNILLLLADREFNVSQLCEELSLPQPTVSHHLGLLRISQLIDNRRLGKQVYYALNGRVICPDGGRCLDISVGSRFVRISARDEAT